MRPRNAVHLVVCGRDSHISRHAHSADVRHDARESHPGSLRRVEHRLPGAEDRGKAVCCGRSEGEAADGDESLAEDFSFAERGRAEGRLDDVCCEGEIVGGYGGGESGVGGFGVNGSVDLVRCGGGEGDGVGGCGGYGFVGVEGEDVWEAGGLVQEGLQLGVSLEDCGCDEDVVVAHNFFGLLAYEGEESDFCHGRGSLSSVDGSQEGRCCCVAVFRVLGSRIDGLRVDKRLG